MRESQALFEWYRDVVNRFVYRVFESVSMRDGTRDFLKAPCIATALLIMECTDCIPVEGRRRAGRLDRLRRIFAPRSVRDDGEKGDPLSAFRRSKGFLEARPQGGRQACHAILAYLSAAKLHEHWSAGERRDATWLQGWLSHQLSVLPMRPPTCPTSSVC